MTGLFHSGRRHRRGFTLVEMLIVVGVLAVLLSLLTPTMGRVREMARRTHCLNNLRNLALAGIAYAGDDEDGFFIPPDFQQGDNFTPWYPRYVSDLRTFVCPSTANVVRETPKNSAGIPRDLERNAPDGAQDSRGGHSYELRNFYAANVTFPDGTRIPVASGRYQNHVPKRLKGGPNVKSGRILLVTDGDDSVRGDVNNWPDRFPDGSSNDNHGAQGFNCSFMDGRAEWLPVGREVLRAYMDGYYTLSFGPSESAIINRYGLYRVGNGYEWR
jgi:prepilin-type N-terminal cleavage/methylation domain-containing protein